MRQLNPTIYNGKVGAKLRPKRHTINTRVYKTSYLCKDGPWNGRTLYLESPQTLTMEINGQTGRYNDGTWECSGAVSSNNN